MIHEIAIDVGAAVTKNQTVQIDGALSVMLHNAGSVTATVNGNLTIAAGSTLQLASPLPNCVFNDNISVRFATEVGARLEVVSTRLKNKALSNY